MEHALIETTVDHTRPHPTLASELDETEDGSPAVLRTTQGPQRWIEQPYPRLS